MSTENDSPFVYINENIIFLVTLLNYVMQNNICLSTKTWFSVYPCYAIKNLIISVLIESSETIPQYLCVITIADGGHLQ